MQNQNDVVAYSIDAFAKAHHTGRTKVYTEIKAGRLRAIKMGKRTLITADAAREWLNNLPRMGEAV